MLIAFLLAAGIGWGANGWREQKERAIANLRRLFSEPIILGQAVLAFVLLVMIAVVLARSGNDSGMSVSGLELKFRGVLDTILPVRPRTKEFLVGHPAMFLGIAAALGGRRTLAGILLVIGTIGEVSLINTFCHLHTPIALSVMRTVLGAAFGLVIGIVFLLLFSRDTSRQTTKTVTRDQVGVEK
jgi:hypothetical protein